MDIQRQRKAFTMKVVMMMNKKVWIYEWWLSF